MGAFVTNFHVRTGDVDAVHEALEQFGADRIRVLDPKQGWVTVYEEEASEQNEIRITQLAESLSSQLSTACIAFMVHDSDIACYWINDSGKLLDHYNSCPDYFDDVSPAEKRRVQGKADVFLRYCRQGVTRDHVEAALRKDVTFAEDIITQLAGFLGIDEDRAMQDYRHDDDEDGPRMLRAFGGDDDDEGDDDTDGDVGGMVQKMQERYASVLAPFQKQEASPENNALIKAVSEGNRAEVERLLQSGVDVNGMGMMPMEAMGVQAPMPAQLKLPLVAMSPLYAAASKGQAEIVRLLLEKGANAKEVHPLFGTALHAATQKGSPETVKALLEGGVPADLTNQQGMTARATLQPIRVQIEMTKKMFASMPQLQKQAGQLFSQMVGAKLPEAGWNECEELLRQAGG